MAELGSPAVTVRALLFDLDGVLVETYSVWHAVMNAIAAQRGYPAVSDEQMAVAWGQGVDADARMFFPGISVAELEALYIQTFPDHLDGLTVMPGASEVTAKIRAAGIRTAVVTNTPAELAREMLLRAGVEPEVLVGGTDVRRPKPEPDIVLRACELLDVPPAEAAVIGDSEFDRRAAEAAGTRFVGFRREGELRVNDLAELPSLLGL